MKISPKEFSIIQSALELYKIECTQTIKKLKEIENKNKQTKGLICWNEKEIKNTDILFKKIKTEFLEG